MTRRFVYPEAARHINIPVRKVGGRPAYTLTACAPATGDVTAHCRGSVVRCAAPRGRIFDPDGGEHIVAVDHDLRGINAPRRAAELRGCRLPCAERRVVAAGKHLGRWIYPCRHGIAI